MRACVLFLVLSSAVQTSAHGVLHEVVDRETAVIVFTYADGSPIRHAEAVIAAPEADRPWLLSRTDAHGVVAFVPDVPGVWSVSVHTDDGHGAVVEVVVDADGLVVHGGPDGPGRLARAAAGLAIIALITLTATLIHRRIRS